MTAPLIVHASCVALPGPDHEMQAALITGRAGTGKSTLALELLSRGAHLVADDRTVLTRDGDRLIASCPPPIAGLIEARGIGLIRVSALAQARVALVVDLDATALERLPPCSIACLLGLALPRILCAATAARGPAAHAAAIVALLRNRGAPEPL
jgi:HPr kinase/phosphorylase